MTIDLPFNTDDVNEVLKVIIARENMVNPDVTFRTGSNIGDGFLGIDAAAEITDGNKRLDLFVKTAPKHEKFRSFMQIRVAYCNEYRFYVEIYPCLDGFYTEKIGKPLGMIPKYYSGSLEEGKEILVLENLKVKAFALNGIKNIFNEEQVVALLRTYGKFHATSLAFKDQNSETFDENTEDIPDFFSLLLESGVLIPAFTKSCDTIKKHLKPEEDKIILEKIDRFVEHLDDHLTRIKEFDGPYCVVTHGDCNNNNIMFRKKKKEEDPLELRLIDFQGMKVTSPMWDVSYFFYTSASTEENLTKLDCYLDIYYETLSTTVKELGSDPETLYPKHLMKEHWKLFSKFSLIMAVMVMSRLYEEEAPNIVDLIDNPPPNMDGMMLTKEDLYVQKVRPLFQHFVDRELL